MAPFGVRVGEIFLGFAAFDGLWFPKVVIWFSISAIYVLMSVLVGSILSFGSGLFQFLDNVHRSDCYRQPLPLL